MKKIILILLLLSTIIYAENNMRKISTDREFLYDELTFFKKHSYTDWCDGEYVWRLYSKSDGSFVQVFENVSVTINGRVIKLSQVKTCKL